MLLLTLFSVYLCIQFFIQADGFQSDAMAPALLESVKMKSKNLELPEQQAIFSAEVSGVLLLLCHQTQSDFQETEDFLCSLCSAA
jgi:hypothetical protein